MKGYFFHAVIFLLPFFGVPLRLNWLKMIFFFEGSGNTVYALQTENALSDSDISNSPGFLAMAD